MGMVAPHCMYAYIWEKPKDFGQRAARAPLNILGGHAVEVMEKLVLSLKVVQVGTLVTWCQYGLLPACRDPTITGSGTGVLNAISSAAPARWILGLGFFIPGQILNMGIYKAIGRD